MRQHVARLKRQLTHRLSCARGQTYTHDVRHDQRQLVSTKAIFAVNIHPSLAYTGLVSKAICVPAAMESHNLCAVIVSLLPSYI